jgi:hypothetical protein
MLGPLIVAVWCGLLVGFLAGAWWASGLYERTPPRKEKTT